MIVMLSQHFGVGAAYNVASPAATRVPSVWS